MFDAERFLRSGSRDLDPETLLRSSVDVLLGVSASARTTLEKHGVKILLDLAASPLFREAELVVSAADDPNSEWAVAGTAPLSVLDQAVSGVPLDVLADRKIKDLRALSDTIAAELAEALDVSTIRELASWPPYVAARDLMRQVVGRGFPPDVWDPGTPPELVPTMGRHPTERVYYQSVLLDRFLSPPPDTAAYRKKKWLKTWEPWQHTAAAPIEASGPVDVTAPLLSSPGFDRVAVGAVVELSQSWYTSGLSLGQLLHSLALAPGESTRIAMVDWQRRERGSRQEGISERDDLSSTQVHNRALNEVVSAVAREVQTGSSASQASGESWGFGKSGGGGGSIGGGEGQSYGFGGGYSLGYGTGKGQASSFSVSTGTRDLRSELTQNVHDLTQQASTMARNRWATVVQEVSQDEHEQLSTRAVSNYNHMHALTIEYFEVVQVYRVSVAVEKVTRCLFVPMQVIDFRRRDVVSRFRSVLGDAALVAQVRTLFSASSTSVVLSLPSPDLTWDMSRLIAVYGPSSWSPGARDAVVPLNDWESLVLGTDVEGHPFTSVVVEYADGTSATLPLVVSDRDAPDAGAPFGIYDFVSLPAPQGGQFTLSTVRRLLLRRSAAGAAYSGQVDFHVRGMSVAADGPVWCNVSVPVTPGTTDVPILDLDRGYDYADVADHLQDNALHYSQAIWSSLDAAAISLALASYTFSGRPLMESIDPRPVMAAGNYLVFRTYVEDDAWATFLDDKNLRVGPVSSTVVPLPSGGVFAEAVLGRSNSAEKLDMTRFWNWQDSPIPITAPEIGALQAGSRNQPVDLKPGELSPSVLNLVNPTTLPDPTGMAAALSALAQGTMFRDMSGLAETIGLTGTSLQEAFRGSSDAQKYAAENFKTAASIFSKGSSKPSTATEDGAKTQQGKDMDAREKSDPGSVGDSEKAAFEASLSDPPLVEATPEGSSPEEWAAWPGATDDNEKGGAPPPPVPKKKRLTILPVTLTFRVFVPSDLWLPHPAVFSSGAMAIALRGDGRQFRATGGRSLAELTYDLRLDADKLTVTEESPVKVRYGLAEVYSFGDTTSDGKTWRRTRKSGVQPIAGLAKRLAHDEANFNATYEDVGDAISVVFNLSAKPQFPWTAENLKAIPDLEVFGLGINWIVDQIIDSAIHDIDARIVLTIKKREDGMLVYDVAGWHDRFPAYELYVNGDEAYKWGTAADLADDTSSERLAVVADRETIAVGAPKAIKVKR